MKISWGYKILFAYLAFVAGILFLVIKASGENYDLVTSNYYDAELKYQDVIDQTKRVNELSGPVKITHSVNVVRVQFPVEFMNKTVQGEIYLYRPSDATKDVRQKFTTQQGFVEMDLERNLSGSYDAKLSWQSDGKSYYKEQRIFF